MRGCGSGKRPKYAVTASAAFVIQARTAEAGRLSFPAVKVTSITAPPTLIWAEGKFASLV
jgi:hypothetical protein